tara:strand:- start:127 stop:927 length:801 start_codon:yes stop_codon:yes gene_type:complete
MFGDQLPETVYVEPMEYSRRRPSVAYGAGPPSNNNMQCIWIGLAAITIVYLLNEQNRMQRPMHPIMQPVQHVAGMLTNIVKGVSAKVAGSANNNALIDACKVFPDLKCGMVSLIDNTNNLANPKEPTPEDVKRKNYETLFKFVNDPKQKRACIVIFAHWCPHCHNLVKELVEKANSIKGNGVKYLLVNGESVHSDAFQGDKAIISLAHYPTILCKVGNMGKEVKSLDEATQLATKTIPDEIAEATEEEQTTQDEEEVDEDPLKMLF